MRCTKERKIHKYETDAKNEIYSSIKGTMKSTSNVEYMKQWQETVHY